MFCRGEGVVTVLVDGSDRLTEQRCDDSSVGVGLDGDAVAGAARHRRRRLLGRDGVHPDSVLDRRSA